MIPIESIDLAMYSVYARQALVCKAVSGFVPQRSNRPDDSGWLRFDADAASPYTILSRREFSSKKRPAHAASDKSLIMNLIDFEALHRQKTADSTEGLHDLIRSRWSPRAFADRDVAEGDLRLLLEAARWAASCNNEQPWRFIVARRSETVHFAKVLDVLVEANQTWAKNAAVLMLTLTSTKFARHGKPNAWAQHDAGLALGNLMLQATALGIMTHGMAGFDAQKARDTFAIPEDLVPVAAVAIGYLADPSPLPEKLLKSELSTRTRKPIEELLFESRLF